MANKVTPAQAAQLFAQMTRQNYQMLPSIAGAENATVTYNVPKVRLTNRIRMMVEMTLNAKHASATSYTPHPFGAFNFIRKVAIDMNNGFSPFSVSGAQLYMLSLVQDKAETMTPKTSGRGKHVQGLVSSAAGTDNVVRFIVDLPLTLNDRDPVGLILTQNQETTVTITVDFDTAGKVSNGAAGYTFAANNITITPMVESFSIPAVGEAFPDLSVLKLVQASKQAITGSGLQTFKFPVGTTYRKIVFLVEDANGGVADASLTGDIELIFNQADRPYKINPKLLAAINQEQFGITLPQGVYAFDMSYQGWSSYGGARDYIDTERLTEFWLQFGANAAGNVTVVYETLSRLRSN